MVRPTPVFQEIKKELVRANEMQAESTQSSKVQLDELSAKIGEMVNVGSTTNSALLDIGKQFAKMADIQNQNRLDELERQREQKAQAQGPANSTNPNSSASKAEGDPTILSKMLAGLGLGVAGLGAGLLRSAAGIAAMGVAIPAFFGGLLIGDATLGFLDMDYNYTNLKAAALGFADIIMSMPLEAFAVLGGIMAISAVGGTRAALGLGSMGAAISGFFAGLLLGDALFSGVSALGYDFDFAGLKKAMVGFSDAILGLSPAAMAVLGTILGGAVIASVLTRTPTQIATGMTALGAGIGGFFIGLALGDAGLSWLNSDFTGIAAATAGFSNAVANLSGEAMATLGVLLAAGGVFGAVTSERTKLKVVLGISAVSAGIAAFFAGFAVMDAAAQAFGTGGSAAILMGNFSDAIAAMDPQTLTTFGTIFAAGAAIGALFGIGGSAAAAAGITLIGAGIAGFFLAFDGLASVANVIGVDGSNAKLLLQNFSDGIVALNRIDGANLSALVGPLALLGPAMVALLGSEGITGVMNAIGGIKDTAVDAWNWMFGNDTASTEPSIFEQVVEMVKPLEDISAASMAGFIALTEKLVEFSMLDLSNIGAGFRNLTNEFDRGIPILARNELDYDQAAENIQKISRAIGVELAFAQTERLNAEAASMGGGGAFIPITTTNNSTQTTPLMTTTPGSYDVQDPHLR
jgi:hypothetical protein